MSVAERTMAPESVGFIEVDFAFMTSAPGAGRPRIWEYYDRRAGEGTRTIGQAFAYWSGLGVNTTAEEVQGEAPQVRRLLRSMDPATFVEVGAGPGTFTADLPGWGIALDQSETALRVLRPGQADTPVVRADALQLPLANGAVDRVFAAHLYGLLEPEDRRLFLGEARRVAGELVVLDADRPQGALPGGQRKKVGKSNPVGKINGWKPILDALTIHYGDRIAAAG
jgi:hypothetical protein